MSADRRARAAEPAGRPDLTFNPVAAGVGVFTAVAAPVSAVGLSLSGHLHGLLTGGGIVLGLVTGLGAGLWLDRRGGKVWNGPRL